MDVYLTEVHSDGAVESSRWEVEYGLTVEAFFARAFRGCDRSRYMMLVNNYPVDWDYLLLPGDRLYIRPFKRPPSD